MRGVGLELQEQGGEVDEWDQRGKNDELVNAMIHVNVIIQLATGFPS